MPFLWVANNEYDAIGKEIEKIHESGSHCFCVESRVHPDFCRENWWRVMDFIVKKASELDMRVWLLDDKHYPTGYANGAVEKRPELRQRHVFSENADVCGPKKNAKLLVNTKADDGKNTRSICAVLLKKTARGYILYADISAGLCGDFLRLDIPAGAYRVCVIKTGTGYDERGMFIDMLNPQSVQLLIDEVYETHYARYKNTCFAGFFSDEPRFSNGISDGQKLHMSYYGANIGHLGMAYPWKDSLVKELQHAVSDFSLTKLSCLWNDVRGLADVRVAYMDCITKAYAANFSQKLSDWCHVRGLQYASHIIEDMGAHTHTYCSAGHYFRSQKGADFAGIDVVLHQIKPYFTRQTHLAPIAGGYADPKFFDNTLAKLASSCARLYSEKKGALCEIFGAYGWAESSTEMLWLVNHMIVRGINRFIPHAFSSVFPNEDCPPYFYADGQNPMYEAYCEIVRYIHSVCTLFEGGKTQIDTAVLYHAEAEWSGQKFLPCDDMAEILLSHQTDFDIVPEDLLTDGKDVLEINGHRYTTLYVPYRAYLPDDLAERLQAIRKNTHVIFVGGKAEEFDSISVKELRALCVACLREIETHGNRDIRVRKICKNERTYFFIHNEGYRKAKVDIATPPHCHTVIERDLLNDIERFYAAENGKASVTVAGGQALVFEFSTERIAVQRENFTKCDIRYEKIVLQDVDGMVREIVPAHTDNITDNGFAGNIQITATIDLRGTDVLQIAFGGESLKAEIDGTTYMRISSPAVIVLPKRYSSVRITLTLATTLAERMRDELSKYSVLSAVGIQSIKKGYKDTATTCLEEE